MLPSGPATAVALKTGSSIGNAETRVRQATSQKSKVVNTFMVLEVDA
jgi:hypothetical protein